MSTKTNSKNAENKALLNKVLHLHECEELIEKKSNLKELLASAVDCAIELTRLDGGFLLLVDPKDKSVYLRAQKGPGDSFVQNVRHIQDDAIYSKLIKSREPFVLEGKQKLVTGFRPKLILGSPLICRSEIMGLLCVYTMTPGKELDELDLSLLSKLAGHVATLIALDRFDRKTKTLNVIKPITRSLLTIGDLQNVLKKIGSG